jgi:Sec-independent protein translocase protein TatA
MFDHGIPGLIIIVVGLIFLFGGSKRLSDLGKGFGGFMHEFNKARKEGEAASEAKPEAGKAVLEGKTIDEVKPEAKIEEPPKH